MPDLIGAEGISQYRLNLAREARRFNIYPPAAREGGWQGDVLVRVSLLPGNAMPVVSLDLTSGHEVLDRQAVKMVENAARQAPVPDSFRDRKIVVSVPVRYSLND